ncbi:30S ribosomal protein S20 [Anthocerotibacter panamensis]|uniref:30S ribosomal protein S20 n=1 Tax=Anthocerotibacter panamensis TaxID=2857077 RepID=UPI001C406058|nr:30S ribosomal protein S20 [Anthocerotibacter panamensis]
MPNIKSAIKRVDVAERNRQHNLAYKSAIRSLTKQYLTALKTYTQSPSPEALITTETALSAAYSKIDRATRSGVLHKNNAARRKSRLKLMLSKALGQPAPIA